MDCHLFDQRLDRLLEGRCTPDEWAIAERHADTCARCRRLLTAMTGGLDDRDAATRSALTSAILARTTGATCASAHERLCDFVDGTLASDDHELVGGHLAGCSSCRALAAALAETSGVLPSLASLDPGDRFVACVLARTVERVPEPGLPERVAAWWNRVTARPRFALEVAYVATLVLMIVVGNPVAAFRDTSARAVAVARPGLERVMTGVVEPVAAVGSGGIARVRSAVATVSGRAAAGMPVVGAERSSVLRRWFAAVFGSSIDALLGRILNLTVSVRKAWDDLWSPSARQPGSAAAPRETQPKPATEPGRPPAR